MRRFICSLGAGLVVLLALGATQAFAAPHFASATSSVNDDGALVVSFDERGLGNGDVDYILTADYTATFACINRGGKNPSASNKRTVSGDVATGDTFAAKNGRVRETLTTDPPSAGDFTCPGGQRLVLADVSYTNIVLTDDTNDVSTNPPDRSRTFFTL
jgi:hypothetical protein